MRLRGGLAVWRNRLFVRLYGTDGRTQRITFYWSVIVSTLGIGVLLLSYPQTYAVVATRLVMGIQNFGAWYFFERELRGKFGPKPLPETVARVEPGARAVVVLTVYFGLLAASLVLAGDGAFAAWFVMAAIPLIGFLWQSA